MEAQSRHDQKVIYYYFLAVSLIIIIAAFIVNEGGILSGWIKILTSPAALTMDYVELGGIGAALLNSGVMGVVSFALFTFSKNNLSAPAFSAYFLTVGFSLFGMNPLNTAPIILGVFIYTRLAKEKFADHINTSLFACAAAPFVSEILFSYYINIPFRFSIPTAIVSGIIIGMVFAPLLSHFKVIHKGFMLFNAGITAGFLDLAIFSLYRTFVLQPQDADSAYHLNNISSDGFPMIFGILFGIIFLFSIILGVILNKGNQHIFKKLVCHTGYDVDFTSEISLGSVYMNIGCLGSVFLLYFMCIGSPINGPVMGALLGIVACAASGSHIRNTLPILIGYIIVSFLSVWNPSDQGISVALCYATCLSPISGKYGYTAGIIAGAFHACLGPFAATICGGLNLYNGGFTAGLAVIILLPLLEAVVKIRNHKT